MSASGGVDRAGAAASGMQVMVQAADSAVRGASRAREFLGNRCRRSTVPVAVFLALVAGVGAHARKTVKAAAAEDESAFGRIVGVRFFSNGDATRVAIEMTGEFRLRSDRLSNPDRVFFDIVGVRPGRVPKGIETIPVGDAFIRQIRIAETQPGTTRIVLDLATRADAIPSQLSNPNRLIIEVRPRAEQSEPASPVPSEPAPEPREVPRNFGPPANLPEPSAVTARLTVPKLDLPPPPINPVLDRATRATVAGPVPLPPPESLIKVKYTESSRTSRSAGATPAAAAKRDSTGERSMTRVLGLKLGRVVLDPGHGGHDSGTRGPAGLLEKDLVLDVSKRLGALIEERMGSEVVYTREDDTVHSARRTYPDR